MTECDHEEVCGFYILTSGQTWFLWACKKCGNKRIVRQVYGPYGYEAEIEVPFIKTTKGVTK